MRRLLRSCLSFFLVSACCVLFCLGVNAASELPDGAIVDDVQLFAALPGNQITTIDTYNSWHSLPDVPKQDRFKHGTYYYTNQQVFAPRYSNGTPVRGTVDLFSLDTYGYTSYEYVWYANNQEVYRKYITDRISFNKPFYVGKDVYEFAAGTNKTISMVRTGINKGETLYLRNNIGLVLEPGIDYELGFSFQGDLPSKLWVESWDTSIGLKSTVVDDKQKTVTFVFNVKDRVLLYRTYVPMVFDNGGVMNINGSYIHPRDDTADKINANNDKIHQETMDKIDEVTDFNDQSQSDLTGTVDGTKDELESKLGILSFAHDFLSNLLGLFMEPPGEPTLTFPAFSIKVQGQTHHVWDAVDVNLAVLLKDFAVLIAPVRFATVLLVYLGLIHYLGLILERILKS